MSNNQATRRIASLVAVGAGCYGLYTQWPRLKAAWREWSGTQQLGALLALVVAGYTFYRTARGVGAALREL
jgi:hypothetical protein